jgi:uncharacterized protein
MDKLQQLSQIIGRTNSAVIAFSGGVDSTFLAKVAGEVLGARVLLVTASSSTYPQRELESAIDLAKKMQLSHRVIVSEELEIAGFSENPADRCYYCKSELFAKIRQIALDGGYESVFEGSNVDDLRDFRPGRRAIKELGIGSPLCDAELTKDEIRFYSTQLGLSTASKPSFACLASRFPYGEQITKTKLDRVGLAEDALFAMGFRQFRVRSHQDIARIEVAAQEMESAWLRKDELSKKCRDAGFTYIALDLTGYRTGAMNEVLDKSILDSVRKNLE